MSGLVTLHRAYKYLAEIMYEPACCAFFPTYIQLSSYLSMSMCQQPPESSISLNSGLSSPTGSCDHPASPLPPSSPGVDDQESSSYSHLKSCAYNSSVCSYSETPYTSSVAATQNGYSVVQNSNSMLNSTTSPLSSMSNAIYPQSMFAAPMYSSTVDYASSFSSGPGSNLWK